MHEIHDVFIIDDDPIFVFGLQRFLKIAQLGKNYIHFSNGKRAIDGLKAYFSSNHKLPELILVDLNMPVMDGWQFLAQFKAEFKTDDVLVFIISSSIDPADINKTKDFPFVREFIYKPISSDKLKELVEKYNDPLI